MEWYKARVEKKKSLRIPSACANVHNVGCTCVRATLSFSRRSVPSSLSSVFPLSCDRMCGRKHAGASSGSEVPAAAGAVAAVRRRIDLVSGP